MTTDSNRALIRRGLMLSGAALVLLAGIYVLVFAATPIERSQGFPQKIFYLHVPAAWCALLGYSIVGVVSLLYLWLKDPRLDLFAASTAEVGVLFSVVMLTSGPLWARPVWGTWWQWDARLTLTLLLFFLFLGYLSLRSAVQDPAERARFSAVVALMGLVLVPFVHLSVYLFRTIHPTPVVLKPTGPTLPGSMLIPLLLSLLVHTLLFAGLVVARYGAARIASREAPNG